MQKYLENPYNAAPFITYNADIIKSDSLDDESITRTIDLKSMYNQFKIAKPNLLCLGPRKSGKSMMLNSLFGIKFDTIEEEALGLFHNSVDVMFDSKEFPSGFNIYDFQGLASSDYKLIVGLLSRMP